MSENEMIETRECPECGEESKPIVKRRGPDLAVVKCPLCGQTDEIPNP